MISVTLQFPDALAASHALARMASPEQFVTAVSIAALPPAPAGPLTTGVLVAGPATIAHDDRPDVGAPVAQPALPPTPPADPVAAAFGGAVVQAAPLVAPTAQPASMPPSAATAPTAAPATAERDSAGLPWDARIHASTKSKTKEGVWTAKRNVDEAFRAQVMADLRGVPVAQTPVAPPAAPQTPAAPPVAPPAAPQAPAPAAAKTFPEYMAEIGAAFSARPLEAHTHMAAALAPHGMQHVGQLAGRPDLIPAVDAEFRRLLG